MRLILTSDLHRDGGKLLWLLEEAPPYDALLIAGDMLDIFSKTSFPEQTSGALRTRQAFINSGKSIAWCSGNHDFSPDGKAPISGASPMWMREQPSTETQLGDGESRLLAAGGERIVVTTIPWKAQECSGITGRLLSEGKQLRSENGVPWIILYHEPPQGTPLAASSDTSGGTFSRRLIEEAKPEFSLHGHIHTAPMVPGGSWMGRIETTVCFNAGQSLAGEPLHYVLLDLRWPGNWTAEWHGDERIEALTL